jgi:hypothetical protein
MTENLEMILNRDRNLTKLSQLSTDLKEDSKKVTNSDLTEWFIVQEGREEA